MRIVRLSITALLAAQLAAPALARPARHHVLSAGACQEIDALRAAGACQEGRHELESG